MARIIIAPARFAGPTFEVDQSVFDAGYYPGYVYVSDATSAASSEATAEEQRVAGFVAGGTVLPAALRAALVPKWKPSTAYASSEFVLNPSGQVVSANTAFTSGSSYSAANWTIVSGGGGASLPTQTGNSGKYLTTDGAVASWGTVAGGGASAATASALGTVQLAGDLAPGGTGSAATPQVRPAYSTRSRFSGRKLTTITSFAAGHGWIRTAGTATLTDDTTATKFNGSQALKITTAGTATTDLITSPVYAAVDLTKTKLVLRIKVDAYANLTKISLRVASGGATSLATNYANTDLLFPTTATNQFTIDNGDYLIPISFGSGNQTTNYTTVGTAPTLTAITTYALSVKDLAGFPVNVTLSGLYTQPTPATTFPKGLYVLTFDDANASHITLAAPYMARYGMVGTEFPVIDSISATTSALSGAANMNLADMHLLEDQYEWGVGCHSDTTAHHGTGFDALSATTLDDTLYAMKSWNAANGFRGGDALAYPQGLANPTTRAAAKKYFSTGRGTSPLMGMETYIPFDPMYLRCRSLSAATTLAQMTADIDYLTNFGGVVVHLIHDIQTGTPTGQPVSLTNFQGLIDYAATAGVTTRTMPDWVRATQSLSV